MQLLVSVRSVDEVEPALRGGADIVDLKEPQQGSLGAVSADVLTRILARIPPDHALSIAMGDVTNCEEVLASVTALDLPRRSGPVYLKFGFAGVRSPAQVDALIRAAVSAASGTAAAPAVVAVGYADSDRGGTVDPALLCRIAGQANAVGVLLDTHFKDGRGLLHWLDPATLTEWVAEGRRAGLLTALAGALDLADLEIVSRAAPDVVGVRGAACEGGRGGKVSLPLVRALRRELDRRVEALAVGRLTGSGRAGWRNARKRGQIRGRERP